MKSFNNIITVALLLLSIQVTKAQVVDGIVAIVGSRTILLSDLETQSMQVRADGMDPKTIRCEVLDGLLTQKLLLAQAVLDSVVVSDDEIENELDRRIRYFANMAGGTARLEEYYGKSIIEIKEEFRDDIREQLLAQRKQQDIVRDIKATPSDVRKFFNSIPADSLPYYNSEVEVGEIVIKPTVSPEVKALAKEQINDLRSRVTKGEDFAKLAGIYSEDPGSRDNGGELGFTGRGELDPAFEAAAFSLKNPNDVSEVIETQFGFHIIQLIERRGERVNARHILITPKTTTYDLNRAKAKADSIHQLITSGKTTFGEAATRYSQDDNTKNNGGMLVNPQTNNTYFDVEQLGQYDPALALSVQNMEVGTVASPSQFKTPDGRTQYRIVYLKSKTGAHRANLKDDYDKIQQMAESDKQNRTFDEWLNEKRSKNYIRISGEYADCPNLKSWIVKNDTN